MGKILDQRTSPVHPGEGFVPSGVAELRRQFPSPESAKTYAQWTDHPVTKLVRKALADMALNGIPSGSEPESIAVQYGITLGLGAAAQMLEDAALVIPGMYRSSEEHVNPADMRETFAVSPQEALDNLK